MGLLGAAMSETSTLKPWYATGRLQWGGNPFQSLGLDWCPRCQQEVDTDTQADHRDGIYSYRRWCLRCGWVVKYGAYQTPLLQREGLPSVVLTWVTQPGKDRR
mgnify:CR=1 FL=1